MSSYNEWELMLSADDIEVGDTISVSDDQGNEELMIYKRMKNKNVIELIDSTRTKRMFSALTLEEIDGYAYICGIASEQLSLKELFDET